MDDNKSNSGSSIELFKRMLDLRVSEALGFAASVIISGGAEVGDNAPVKLGGRQLGTAGMY